jgi:hypothetical protein
VDLVSRVEGAPLVPLAAVARSTSHLELTVWISTSCYCHDVVGCEVGGGVRALPAPPWAEVAELRAMGCYCCCPAPALCCVAGEVGWSLRSLALLDTGAGGAAGLGGELAAALTVDA